MIHGKTLRVTAATAAASLLMAVTAPAMAADSVLLSALLPGLGQSQEGHYGKATIFGSAAIVSLLPLCAVWLARGSAWRWRWVGVMTVSGRPMAPPAKQPALVWTCANW